MPERAQGIHSSWERRHTPSASIVFTCFEQHLVWVRHPIRGWELPGGKVDPGETPDEAAHREAWEESGATLAELEWMGEYALSMPGEAVGFTYKWVYVGRVNDVGARPENSEIIDVRVFRPNLTPEEVPTRGDFSYVVKDDMFRTFWPMVQRHGVFLRS